MLRTHGVLLPVRNREFAIENLSLVIPHAQEGDEIKIKIRSKIKRVTQK